MTQAPEMEKADIVERARQTQCCDVQIDAVIGGLIAEIERLRSVQCLSFTRQREEIAWVIERDTNDSTGGLEYYTGLNNKAMEWHRNHEYALRFARQIDADNFNRNWSIKHERGRVAEHVWLDVTAPPAGEALPAQEGRAERADLKLALVHIAHFCSQAWQSDADANLVLSELGKCIAAELERVGMTCEEGKYYFPDDEDAFDASPPPSEPPEKASDVCAACGAERREHMPGGIRWGEQSLCGIFIPLVAEQQTGEKP